MKKLSLFVMILTLAMFMPAIASAQNEGRGAIQGTYAMTGTGNCLWSVLGFDSHLNAIVAVGKPVFGSHFATRGNWEFWQNGYGHTKFTQFGIVPPAPILPPPGYPNAASLEFEFDFTYTVTHDGLITIEMLPETFQGRFLTGPNANLDPEKTFTIDKATFVGSVSTDHKTLTLTGENELQTLRQFQYLGDPPALTQVSVCPVICNTGRVLIRVSNETDK